MPATATLLPPLLSLNLGGEVFKQGVPKPVSYEVAASLKNNRRFLVEGLDTREAVDSIAHASRPEGDSLMQAIRDAADELDVDDDSNFDRHGKVDHRAIGDKLGYSITIEERDRALGYPKSAKPSIGQIDTAEGKIERTDGRKTIAIPRRAQTPPSDPTTAGAVAV